MTEQPQNDAGLSTSGAAIAGIIVGIIGLLGSAVPILNNFAFIIAIVGLVLGIVAMVGISKGKHKGKGIAIAAIVISVVACIVVFASQSLYSAAIDQATEETLEGTSMSEQASADDYALSETTIATDEYGSVTISGEFTNNLETDMDSVSLEYSLYDADNKKIESAYAYGTNIKAGEVWKFDATAYVGEGVTVDHYELADVIYF